MKTLNIAEAKARLSELIELAARGEVIVLARSGTPRAKIVSLGSTAMPRRRPGKGRARFHMEGGFDDPLPEEILQLFESGR